MKTKQVLTVMITSLFLLYGCSNNQDSVEELKLDTKSSALAKTEKGSVINQEYPDAQAEVYATFGAIATSITLGAGQGANSEYMDQLISFHDYSNIFTEFNYDSNGNGFLTDGEGNEFTPGNEDHERELFGENVINVQKFAYMPGTLKIAVYYGNVANLTFISDFVLDLADGTIDYPVNNLITLLFIKTNGEWKMVHEHHSPVTVGTSSGTPTPNIPSDFDPNTASPAQLEVLTTFGAIAKSIMYGAGNGYDGVYMDELISFHAYGPKFTEFNYDEHGNGFLIDDVGNEDHEREFFGTKINPGGVHHFGPVAGTLNIAVYHRNVANVTFISDFQLKMTPGSDDITNVNNLITLLFVKTKGEWKLVHEHHSPLNY